MTRETYTVSTLAAALQPNAAALGNLALTELDRVVAVRLNNSQALLLALDEPSVLGALDGLSDERRVSLREKGPRGLEHIDMRHALVTGSADDDIDIERLLVHNRSIDISSLVLAIEVAADLDFEVVALLRDGDDLARGQNAVGPLGLVGAENAALMVHDLVEVLDELEADDAVVGGLGVGKEVGAVSRGAGVDGIDEFGVEDGVDAGRLVSLHHIKMEEKRIHTKESHQKAS